jgi:glycosyltransferase involved in cell wall biosynthesis
VDEVRPLLSFVAILKNEATNIRATLESVRPYIDRWTVMDTGSTDGTDDIVREVLSGVPGHLAYGFFTDFSETRNRALVLDRFNGTALFTLMLSGDETLHDGEALRAFLEQHRDDEAGAYCVMMQSGTRTWPFTRVLRSDAGWRYVGEVHERPIGPQGEMVGPLIPTVKIVHAPSDPERKVRRLREFDLPRLTQAAEDTSKSIEERAHAMFFLAETLAALAGEEPDSKGNTRTPGGQTLTYFMTAMSFYWRYAEIAERTGITADYDKAMYSYMLYYNIAEKIGFFTSAELVARLEVLTKAAPRLPEAHWLLAKHAGSLDVRQGLFLALEAARVAREARENPSLVATDARIEGLSLLIAAHYAQAAGKLEQARELAGRAVAAGASREALGALLT